MAPAATLSNSRVDRAGLVLRDYMTNTLPTPDPEDLRNAAHTVEAFRAAHRLSMHTARMGLQSCVTTEGYVVGGDTRITQRLKRRATVWDKLRREPTMKLSRMQDIGGCRAVLPSLEAIERVRDRFTVNSLRRNGNEDRVIDYVHDPRESGYRAVHIHTRYRGRRVEVQLRTPWQHRWARLVEDLTSRTGIDYKSGDGNPELHQLLRSLGDTYATRDATGPDRLLLDTELRELAEQIAELGVALSANRLAERGERAQRRSGPQQGGQTLKADQA